MKRTVINRLVLMIAGVAVAILQAPTASAAWGDKDPGFGFFGVYTDNCSSNCTPYDTALQSDGKILVTGSRELSGKTRFFLRRYLSNGSVDTNFGNSGYAVSSALINVNYSYWGHAIAVQPDGKIVVAGIVAGSGGLQIVVWRFTAGGTGDNSFGYGGMRVYPQTFWQLLSLNIAVQNGKLVIGYTDNPTAGIYYGVLVRLNSNGLADTTFGNNGQVYTSSISILRRLLIEPDTNKIVFASEVSAPSLLSRKLPDGADDPGFQSWNDSFGSVAGLVRLGSGKYLASLATDSGYPVTTSRRSVVRLSPDGVWEFQTPDYTESAGNQFHFLGVQKNGRVVVGSPNGFYRFNSNLDDFSREIYTGANLPAMNSSAYSKSVVLQPDDKMIVVSKSSTGRITLTRVLSN